MDQLDDQRAIRVSALASTVTEASELMEALGHLADDPASSLTKSRVALERILRSILNFEQRPIPERAMIGKLLRDDVVRRRTPAVIHAAMEYINRVASAEGAHVGQASRRTAARALDHICDVLEWYSAEYLTSGLVDNFGGEIAGGDALVVYVSTGGTCRCAMANVITRHLLQTLGLSHQIRPMSAALHEPTRSTMSEEAVQVVREELGIDVAAHQTVCLDERYVRRSNLLLAMDSKLFSQLPNTARGKASLFAEFYGGAGNIEDPWQQGLEAYRARFREIQELVSRGTNKLVSWLARG